jgi:hypothetical protein
MKNNIVIGDYVRCIACNNTPNAVSLTVGRYYKVSEVDMDIYYVDDDSGDNFGYYSYRFEYSIKHSRIKKLDKLFSISEL